MKAEDRMIRWRAQAALNVERQQIQEAAEEALRNSEERLRFALDASRGRHVVLGCRDE